MSWLDEADGLIAEAMDSFGEPVAFEAPVVVVPETPFGGRGKFDEHHEAVDLSGEAPVSSTALALTIRIADFDIVPQVGNRLTVRGQRYEIYDPQPDGQGGIKLLLKRKKS